MPVLGLVVLLPSSLKLKRMGLRGQPCFTPLLKRMGAVIPLAVRTHMVEFVYMSLTISLVCGPTPVQWSISISTPRGTDGKGIRKIQPADAHRFSPSPGVLEDTG